MSFFQSSITEFSDADQDSYDLQAVCKLGDLSLIKKAFERQPHLLNSQDSELGWTALYRVVVSGNIKAALYLLEQGADPNLLTNLGETPLHQAADNSQYLIAELLIRFGAEVDLQQHDGDSALHHAVFRGDTKMVAILLKHSANANLPNFLFGRTPLHYAAEGNHFDCIKILVAYNGDLQKADRQGWAPIDLIKDQEFKVTIQNFTMNDCEDLLSPIIECSDEELASYVSPDIGHFQECGTFGKISIESGQQEDYDYYEDSPMQKIIKISEVPQMDGEILHQSLYDWLEKHGIAQIYEILVENGYDDIESMIAQMRTPLPITPQALEKIGILKAGLRYQMIIKLEEEAGIVPRPPNPRRSDSQSTNFLKCCTVPSNATIAILNYPSLKDWLSSIKLGYLQELFEDQGWRDYEQLIQQMYSRYPLTDQMLEEDVGITKPFHRSRVLGKLQEDIKMMPKDKVTMETSVQKASCELCYIF